MNNELPQRINVMKVVTYDVQKIVEDVHECHGTPFEDITIEDCLTWISDWVADDFSCGYGHTADTGDLIFQDENGEEL